MPNELRRVERALLSVSDKTGLIDFARALGIAEPKVAILSATEKINPKLQSTVEAAALADHVWIMDAGRVVVDGTVADLTGDGSLEDAFLRHTSGDRP